MSTKTRGQILYVYSGKAAPQGAGLDLVARRQMKALTEGGYSVTFVSRGSYKHPNVRNISLPLTPANLGSMLSAKYYYNLQHRFFSQLGALVLGSSKFNAVVGWQGSSRTLFKAASARGVPSMLNCPGVCADSASDICYPQLKLRTWPIPDVCYFRDEYTLASTLLTASEQARETFARAGFPEKKVVNIQRGADLSRYRSVPREAGPFRAVFFGRVCDRKGIFQTIEAWEKAALPEAELWIIGAVDRSIEDELKLKLPKNAVLFGHRNDAEVLLPQCHVQVLPTAMEGMAKTLVEGAACGCVSLVTKESGLPVIEGKTGFVIERAHTDLISQILKRLASDRHALGKMHEDAASFVKQHLSWESFSQKFLSAVEAVSRR